MNSDSVHERDTYLVGYGDAAQAWIGYRTAESHAAFFIPFLKPGMALLDAGCGPGGITVGLAKCVHPRHVTAIDIEPEQLTLAKERAREHKAGNIKFEEASIFNLPYADNTFDAVFMSAVLSNLQRPDQAMTELFRVLKPGGIAGLNEFDSGGDIYYPFSPLTQKSRELYFRLREHVGDDPMLGRRLKSFLHQAGFKCMLIQAIYENIEPEQYTRTVSTQFQKDLGPQVIALGWTDQKEIDAIASEWREVAKNPDAFFAVTWVQAVGQKPE